MILSSLTTYILECILVALGENGKFGLRLLLSIITLDILTLFIYIFFTLKVYSFLKKKKDSHVLDKIQILTIVLRI